MNLLIPGKPCARCPFPTTVSGSSRIGALGIRFGPMQLHLLKSSLGNNCEFSISNWSFYQRESIACRFPHFVPSALAETCPPLDSDGGDNRKLVVVGWSATTLVLVVASRVFQKLALVPMKEYPFFLAQFNSFVYVVVYFSVLRVRYNAGITTDEMLALPKLPFIVIGFLESISVLSVMYAGAVLPGPAIPLLYQTFLVWQLVFSSLFLGRRYSLNQILGCFLVAAGVVVAVSSGGSNNRMLSGINPLWPALMILSSAFQAGSSIVKESVSLVPKLVLRFIPATIFGKPLDIFVVSSFGSRFQALFILLVLPILASMKGIPISELPSYFKSGAACFLNIGTHTVGCDGAPLLPLIYTISNLLFNISLLNLLKVSNAIVTSLASRASVPISVFVLTLPLPYLPKGGSLSPSFLLGTFILVVGLVLYNAPRTHKHDSDVF